MLPMNAVGHRRARRISLVLVVLGLELLSSRGATVSAQAGSSVLLPHGRSIVVRLDVVQTGEAGRIIRKGAFVLGAGENPWWNSGTRANLTISKSSLRAMKVTPRDLLDLIRDRAIVGRVRSTLPYAETPLEYLFDDDRENISPTGYEARGFGESATIYVDLGTQYPISRVILTPAPSEFTHFSLPQHLEIGLNDGNPKDLDAKGYPVFHPVWNGNIDGYTVQRITFPAQYARYVGVTISETDCLRIFDLAIHANGYPRRSQFVSRVIDFGSPTIWGKLRWTGTEPPGTIVWIRTRAGDDDDPYIYWRRIGTTERYTNETELGTRLTLGQYERLQSYDRGPVTLDTENWSTWSAPYPFGRGAEGFPVQSPDARRHLQFKVEFDNAPDTTGTLDFLSVEASSPVCAYVIMGEITPSQTIPAEVTTFTYGLRPRFDSEEELGFDTIEIATSSRPTVRSVMVDSSNVPFTHFVQEDPPGVVVHLREVGFLEDNAVVEITFDCAVYRYGTGFPGYISNSRYEGFPQRVMSGDALEDRGEDDLTVRTKLETRLVLQPDARPDPFTPNGDGINDFVDLSYTILKLSAPAPVHIVVYDLSGHPVRHLCATAEKDGVHSHQWDGKDDAGHAVSPGIYLYHITLDADAESQSVIGAAHVVY